jgi:tRNA wybutosine-synthesizing protein 2
MRERPFDAIKENLSEEIPAELVKKIPNKWEKIGDVLIIVIPTFLDKYKKIIGETYADVLKCKSVLNDHGGISGEMREPNVELIYGSNDTETIHFENGVRFRLDPQKVMFSSGNMNERIRMATISKPDEAIVDLFAGIGYFTLPIATHSSPKIVYAIEKNPVAYNFLCKNISLNNVSNVVDPIMGDNREVAPENVADRVVMGYFGATIRFLPTAFRCLKDGSGMIHFQDKFPDDDVPNIPIEHINNEARKFGLIVDLQNHIKVKSFAPGISHYVFDLGVTER